MPAAWPIAMHWAIERTDAWASCSAEKQRPDGQHVGGVATINVRSGMPTAVPSGRYSQMVPVAAATVVVLDGRAAQSDLIVELAGGQHVLPGEAVVAVHAPGLPHADLASTAPPMTPAR